MSKKQENKERSVIDCLIPLLSTMTFMIILYWIQTYYPEFADKTHPLYQTNVKFVCSTISYIYPFAIVGLIGSFFLTMFMFAEKYSGSDLFK